jgi:hypothetical protein
MILKNPNLSARSLERNWIYKEGKESEVIQEFISFEIKAETCN